MIQTLISSFVASKVGQTKIPGFSQKIGEFTTSKTNFAGSPLTLYGGYLLTQDPSNVIGHAYLIGGVALIAIKDAIVKLKR
jgi:hypothetical protein